MKNEQTAIIKQFSHLGKVNVSIAGAVLSAALFLANPNVKEIKADTVTDKESQVNDHKVIDNHESSQNQNNQVAKVKLIADQITTNSGNKESTAQRLSQTEQSKQQPQLNDKKDHTKISSQSEEPSNNTWNGLKVTYNDQTKALTINKGGSITDPDPIASNIPHYQDIESINIADKIKIWGKANNLFANLPNLKSIKNLDNLDTSQVTHMTGMFANDSSLQSLDLSSLDTSNCGAMDRMFSNDANLTTLALNKFNTSKVKYMQYMFDGDSSLTKLDLSNFKAIETVDSSYMFRNCANLTNLTFEDFGGEKIVYFMHMFDGCTKLSELDLSSFESKVASDTSYMFSGCTNLTNLKTPDINTSQVVYMNSMFKNCGKLEKLDLSTFNTTSALSMSYMFYNDLSLKYLNLSSFSMHQVIYKENMLSGLKDLAVFVLGKDSVISGTGLDTPKDWIRVKGGTIQHPKGTIKISSTNLAANYNGETDADTYVHNNLQSLYKATINYIDLDNNSVLEADKVDIVSGTIIQYKEKYNQIVNSLISKGYVLNSSKSNLPLNNEQNISIPDNVTGDITYTVAFNHREAPKQGKAVTIHYQDTTGNDLIQPIIINGKIGDPYTSQEKKFSDYQLKEVKGNKTGTISDTEQNIYYIYEKITKPAPDPSIPTSSKATINYIDLDNNSVLESDKVDIVSGTIIQYKEKYNQIVNSLISKGYVLNSSKSNLPLNNEQNISIPDNVTGDITYTVAFNHREAPKQGKAVTIHYQDTTGNDLIQPIIINGKIGDPYTSQEKKFSDYQLKEVKGNKTGTISDTEQNIYYIYEKITKPAPDPSIPTSSKATINYIDLDNNSVLEADEVDIVPGTIIQYKEKYNQIVNSLISKGYVLNSSKSNLPLNNEQNISIPDNVTGDITYTVAFNHREAPKQGKAVTIHYQDTTGNDLIQPIIINGKIGDPYTSQEKKFSDYQLKEVKGNKTGTISDTAQNIYYIYEKITKPAPNPLQPSHKSPMSPNKSDLNQSSAPENRHSHQTEPSNEQKQLILPNKHRRNLSIWEKREQQQSSEKSKQDLANASNHQLVTIPRLMSNKLTVPPDDKVNKNSMLPQTGSNQKEKNLFTFSGIIALLMTLIGGLGFKRKKKQD